MPTYEYRCVNGHDFEEFVLRISAAKSELPCPACGERGERRLSAGGGLLFKGSGFYITDYGKDGKKSARTQAEGGAGGGGDANSKAAAKPDGSTGDATRSDAKSAAKSAATADAKPDAKPASTPSKPAKSGE